MAKTYCENCNKTHTALMCFYKPRTKIKPKADYAWDKTKYLWKEINPADKNGYWDCYLQISPFCHKKLYDRTLTLDHVIPRSKGKKYKYDISNLKACCYPCNILKGSRSIEGLAKQYPHLTHLLINNV